MLRLDRRFRLRRARQPATFARSGFRKQLERLRHQPLLDAGEMHIDDRAHGVGVREADVVEEAAAQESVGLLLLVVRRDLPRSAAALTVSPVSKARTRRRRR